MKVTNWYCHALTIFVFGFSVVNESTSSDVVYSKHVHKKHLEEARQNKIKAVVRIARFIIKTDHPSGTNLGEEQKFVS